MIVPPEFDARPELFGVLVAAVLRLAERECAANAPPAPPPPLRPLGSFLPTSSPMQ
jgi:hypothetical protein